MQNGEPNIYTAIATLYNGRIQLQWQRVQVLFGFNAIALPATSIANQPAMIKILVSMIGIIVHTGIFVASQQSIEWIAYWSRKLADLERLDQDSSPTQQSRVAMFSDEETQAINRYTPTSAYQWPFGIGIAIWVLQLIWYALDYPALRKLIQ